MVKTIIKTAYGDEFLIETETADIDEILKEATEIACDNDIDADDLLQPDKFFEINSELDLEFTNELKEAYFAGTAKEIISKYHYTDDDDDDIEMVERMLDYAGSIYLLMIANDEDTSFRMKERDVRDWI